MKTILKLFSVLLLSTIVNASSSWIPITMGDILSFVPSVSISPVANIYPVNATVSVNVNGTLSNNKDWIGIFKKGTQKKWGNQIAWNFVDGKSRAALTRNKLPMPAGEYEVALFFNNSLNKVEATATFTVRNKIVDTGYGAMGNEPIALMPPESLIIDEGKNEDHYVAMYYPKNLWGKKKIPLVVLIGGFSGTSYTSYTSLLKFIASHGYAAAFVPHPYMSGEGGIGATGNGRHVNLLIEKLGDKIDTSKIGIIGHSSGGGSMFKALQKISEDEYGTQGRFMMGLDAYYPTNMNADDLTNLVNTNIVFQNYNGTTASKKYQDPRIVMNAYYLLTGIPNANKDYHIITSDNADHGYPSKSNDSHQLLVKTLGALMAYTFENKQQAYNTALNNGTDNLTAIKTQYENERPDKDNYYDIEQPKDPVPAGKWKYTYHCTTINKYAEDRWNDGGVFDGVDYCNDNFEANTKPTISIVTKEANKPVTINVQGKLSGKKDWAGIYKKGEESNWGNVIAWGWIDKTGRHVLDEINPIQMPVGNYEARLFYDNSFHVEATKAFSVTGIVAPVSNVQNAGVNKPVTVTINKHHIDKDWVGIFKKGVEKKWGNEIAWSYVNGKNSVTINPGNKLPAGEYVVALFLDNSLDKVEFSVGFKVVGGANNDKVYPPETTLTAIEVDPIDRPARPAHKLDHYKETAFDDTVTRTVTRVTNRAKDNIEANGKFTVNMNGHQYPKQGTAWNSDMSLFRLTGRIYDAETLKEIPLTKGKHYSVVNTLMEAPKNGASGIRWSKHNPNVLYVIGGDNQFHKLTINADKTDLTSKVICNLGNRTDISNFTLGHDEGNIDYDDRYVVLSATKTREINGNPVLDGNGHKVFDIYVTLLDIQEKRLVWESKTKKLPYPAKEFDWVSISPSGNYILIAANSKITLYNRNLEQIRVLANRSEHGDIGYDQNGNEMFVQFHSGGLGIFGYILNDNPQYEKPIKLLDSNHGGGHISCRNYKRKGWCYVSTDESGFIEVFALKLDGSKKVQRFAKTYGSDKNYPANEDETKAYYVRYRMGIPSPDGTRILFLSDYGNPEHKLYYKKELIDGELEWVTQGGDWWDKIDTYQVRISK